MQKIQSIATESLELKSNPYLKLFYGSLRERGIEVYDILNVPDGVTIDLVHLHWPEKMLRKLDRKKHKKELQQFLRALATYKVKRVPIVWTVHNALPHEQRASAFLTKVYYKILSFLVDGCLYMSESGRNQCGLVHPRLASKRSAVIPHGHYRDVVSCSQPSAVTRQQLGVDSGSYLIGHYGLIRGYKNTLQLVNAFRELAPEDAVLVIGGKPWSTELEEELESAIQGSDRIRFINRSLTEAEMSDYVSASDLVALPYKRVSNSGAALYALSLDTPVLGPAQGAFQDLAEGHPDWVYTYQGEFTAEVLGAALEWVRTGVGHGEVDLSAYDWALLADQTIHFYESLQARPPAKSR